MSEARTVKTDAWESGRGKTHHVWYPSDLGEGQLKLTANYYLWIPDAENENKGPLRGVIVHQHGCGPGASTGGRTAADDLHWQALARKHNCALMGSMYEPKRGANCRLWCDARRGSDARFQQALAHFAEVTERRELTAVPWCLWGHSGGGFWSSLMQVKHPDKIVAIWLRSGTAFQYWRQGETPAPTIPPAAYKVPVMANPGLKEKGDERFHRAWDGLHAMREAYLEAGAGFFEWAPDPRTSHECGDSRYLSILFFDFWLSQRLPEQGSSLQAVSEPMLTQWKKVMAPKLAEYTRTGAVADDTAPPAPHNLQVVKRDGKSWLTWDADADLESGIGHFEIYQGDRLLGRVPAEAKGRFGRPLFQGLSYHDTPEAPIAKMEFPVDDVVSPSSCRVVTVNSVGLKSKQE